MELDTNFMREADCQNTDPTIWHPEKKDGSPYYKDEHGNPTPQVIQARSICKECPVKLECLQFAMAMEARPSHAGRYGVWAGTTPEQRQALAEQQKLDTLDNVSTV